MFSQLSRCSSGRGFRSVFGLQTCLVFRLWIIISIIYRVLMGPWLSSLERRCVCFGLWSGSRVQILAKACAFFENGELGGAILFVSTCDNKFHQKVVYFNQLSGAQRTRISYHDRMPVCYLDCPLFKWHLNNGHLFPIVKMLD